MKTSVLKKIVSAFMVLLWLNGCSSLSPKPEELKAAPDCKVWTKNIVGLTEVADIVGKEEMAKYKVTCWIQGMFLCTWDKYTFTTPGGSEITSSIQGKVGHLNGNKMDFDITGLKSDSVVIQGGHVEYDAVAIMGPPRHKVLDYNKACTTRQVALGILSLAGK